MEERRENFSRKRAAILAALQQTDVHPTAEWVYSRLKPQYPDLSLATVYRNLNRFCQTGQAVSLGSIGGYERFDGDLSPHSHLICARCGAVVDVFASPLDAEALAGLSRQTGCKIEEASVQFHGLCARCAQEDEHGA